MAKAFGLMLVLVMFGAGCGVWCSAEYSVLLDKTAAISSETAIRAQAGTLSSAEMTQALVLQAETWQRFRDARDGQD